MATKPKNQKPSAAELTALRNWLKAHGVSASDAAAIVNAAKANRGEIAVNLATHLKHQGTTILPSVRMRGSG